MPPFAALRDQIVGIRLERIGRWPTPASPPSGARPGAAASCAPCAIARSSVEPIDALLAQEVRGVALLFLQQEHQQRAALHLLRARRGGMHHGALDDAIEAERRFGLDGFLAGHRREGAIEHLFEIGLERREVDAAARQDVARLRILDQRVQHVLEADEIVAAIRRDAKRAADAFERIGCERNGGAAHSRGSPASGSMVTSNGYSCCSASCCGGLDLGFGDVARKQAGDADAGLVDVHHDGKRVRMRQMEDRLEHPDDEFLRREVVVVQQDLPQARVLDALFDFGLGLDPVADLGIGHSPIITPGLGAGAWRLSLHDPRRVRRRSARSRVHHPGPARFRDQALDLGHKRAAAACARRPATTGDRFRAGSRSAGSAQRSSCAASRAIAIFEASVRRENIDSPKNIRPMPTP